MSEALALYEAETLPYRVDTTLIFARNVERLSLAQDAADEWLRDPDNPERYFLGSRAGEVEVVFDDHADLRANGEPRRKRETLQKLLQRAEAPGTVSILQIRERFADPREYLLKTSEQLRGELTLAFQALEHAREQARVKGGTPAAQAESLERIFAVVPLGEILAASFQQRLGVDAVTAKQAAGEHAEDIRAGIVAWFKAQG